MANHRNFGLDLARALAIGMVFLSHGVSSLDFLGVGVDLFFVLSGFLIGRIYLRGQADAELAGGTFSLGKFWAARWLRTLPPYFAALLLFALLQPQFHNNAVHWYYLLFLQNYVGIDGFGPSWSLSVEEHFYLALPVFGLAIGRWHWRPSLLWLLPLLGCVPFIIRALQLHAGALPANWYWRSHLHAEGLVFGVWLAYLYVDRQDVWRAVRLPAWLLSPLPIFLLAYQQRTPLQLAPFQVTVFLLYALGFAAWLRILYDMRWKPRTFAGRLTSNAVHGAALASYSIYLLPTLLFTDVRVLVDGWPRGPVKTGTILLSSLAVSCIFYFLVERQSIRLRDRVLAAAVHPAAPHSSGR